MLNGSESIDGRPRILVGISGSVAAVGMAGHLFGLRSLGPVKAIMTRSAERFITADSIALACDEVIVEDCPAARKGSHIKLTEWANAFVVMPASAHVIGCAANGIAPSVLTSSLIAARPGVVFIPNMNIRMWNNPSVQRNVRQLEADGHTVLRNIRPGLEVATGEIEDAPVIPPTDELVEFIAKRCRPTASTS